MSQETPKFLIYKATGGLAHNLLGLSSAIDFSNITNRKLIIDTSTHKGFGVKYSTLFKTNFPFYENYECIPKKTLYRGQSIDTISKTAAGFVNKDNRSYYTMFGNDISVLDINNNEDIIILSTQGVANTSDLEEKKN